MNTAAWVLIGLLCLAVVVLVVLLLRAVREARAGWAQSAARGKTIASLQSEEQSLKARLRNANRDLAGVTAHRDNVQRLWSALPARLQAVAKTRVAREDEVAALKAEQAAADREVVRRERAAEAAAARIHASKPTIATSPSRTTSRARSTSSSRSSYSDDGSAFATAVAFAAISYVDTTPSCDVSGSMDCGGF